MPTLALLQKQREEQPTWIEKTPGALDQRSTFCRSKTVLEGELLGTFQAMVSREREQIEPMVHPPLFLTQEVIIRETEADKKRVLVKTEEKRITGARRLLSYSVWEQAIIVLAIIAATITFIFSLMHAWPELMKLFSSLASIAHAAGPKALPKVSTDYAGIKDLIVTGGVIVLVLWSAGVYYHSDKRDDRKKVAADLIKLSLGYLFGQKTSGA